ncbi:MAG: hypothetical protein HY350_04325 [Candidatus Omnitrophica bacterium]|nr:hypothetical protein [Candidatus Omnitrophota bacterium]
MKTKIMRLFCTCLAALIYTSSATHVLAQSPDLASYWNFNNSILDSSGNDNNGTVTGTTTWATGKVGNAFDFNGNTSINFGNNPSLSVKDNISIEFWIYPKVWPTAYAILPINKWTSTTDANYVMYFYGIGSGLDKQIGFYSNAGGTWKNVSPMYALPNLNTWYHVVWTYNSVTGGQLYINGVAAGSLTGSGVLATNTANAIIGRNIGADGLNGILDEVKIYDKALTSTEVTQKYQDAQIRGSWNLHGDALDSSGNGNNGTVSGTTSWVTGKVGKAFDFDGTTSINCGANSSLSISDNISIELWFYPKQWCSASADVPISKLTSGLDANYVMYFHGPLSGIDKTIGFYANAGGTWQLVSPLCTIPSLNTWYHVVWTYNSATGGKLYVNNGDYGAPVGSGVLTTNTANLLLGKDDLIGTAFRGILDEVKVYNRVLSASDVTARYNDVGVSGVVLENDTEKLTVDASGKITELLGKPTGLNYSGGTVDFAKIKKSGSWYSSSSCLQKDGRLLVDFGSSNTSIEVSTKTKGKYFVFQVYSTRGDNTAAVEEINLLNITPSLSTYDYMSGVKGDTNFTLVLRAMNPRSNVVAPFPASCVSQYGITLAKWGLLGNTTSSVRADLKPMVEDEGLPRSDRGGPWAEDSSDAKKSYLFAFDISTSNVNQYITGANDCGSKIINFYDWWNTIGHYAADPTKFPNGLNDLKSCVDSIHAAGLQASLHTMTGCISEDDAYVTPVPDSRLTKDAQFSLLYNVGINDTTIYVNEQPQSSLDATGKILQIGNELITYTGYTQTIPYNFFGCVRGAFGTTKGEYGMGTRVDHMYFIDSFRFFTADPDSTLVKEIASNITNVMNYCGFDMVYLDGAAFMSKGWYGASKMGTAIFNTIGRNVRLEASDWFHLYWTFYSNVGAWDYPVYGIKSFINLHADTIAPYHQSKLLPTQLGWWYILGFDQNTYSQLPDEVELLCARMLGHDAALSHNSPISNPPNARQSELFQMIKTYEEKRAAGTVSESIKSQLRTSGKEFHLKTDGTFIERKNPLRRITLIQGDENTSWDPNINAYWCFNNTVNDFSGNGNNGTVTGTTTYVTGKVGKAFDFNGNTSINCGNNSSLSISDNISIEFWIYPKVWPTAYSIQPVSKWTTTSNANYVMYFYGSASGGMYKYIGFYANAGGTWKNVSPLYLIPNLNTWYHVVWTYNSGTGGQLYINGTAAGSLTGSGVLTTNNKNVLLGRSGTSGESLNGTLDEVKIYNRVLSSTEVQQMYQAVQARGEWVVNNEFSSQAVKLRMQALHSAATYDGTSTLLTDFQQSGEFTLTNATNVTSSLTPTAGGGCTYTATNSSGSSSGAWSKAAKTFSPLLDIGTRDTIGVWVKGDNKGEIINFQLSHDTPWPVYAENYLVVDFNGWKYIELPVRERNTDTHYNYVWPYYNAYALHMYPLNRPGIQYLNIYYNNLPVGQQVSCLISPVKALQPASVSITNPSLTIGAATITFPVTLQGGEYLEFYSTSDCKRYSAAGAFIANVTPTGTVPTLSAGNNTLKLDWTGTNGYTARVGTTLFIDGGTVN